jgi:hypothetical protein
MRYPILAALCALLVLGQPVHAQVSIGVAGGPSTPLGSLSDAVKPGFHGGVVLDLRVPLLPLAVRGEAMVQRLPGAGGMDPYDVMWGAANGRFDVLPLPMVGAYVTGGAGLYSSRFNADQGAAGERTTSAGLNLGIGADLNLLVIRPFIEARYHRVLSDPARAFLPITFGVYF